MNTLTQPVAKGVPAGPQPERTGRILELDGVRALAILLVIGCHYQAFASSLWRVPELGWVGVDIFFVLSGYLITTILLGLRGQPHAYRVFYARRARRILPPYFLAIAGCILISFLGYTTIKVKVPIASELRTIGIYIGFLKSLLMTPEIFDHVVASIKTGHMPSLLHSSTLPWIAVPGLRPYNLKMALLPAWSLSVEEWFYILWAPVVLCSRRYGVISAILLSIIVGFLWELHT